MKQSIVLAIALVTGITAVPVDSFTESSMGRQVTAQGGKKVTVPVGTRILIRTIDPLDPSKQGAGQLFGGILETNILVDDVIVATRETIVHGRLTTAKTGGQATGGSRLVLELTDILIDGTPYPIDTDTFDVRSRGLLRAGRTNGEKARVAAGVGLGALLGGAIGIGKAAGAGVAAGTAAISAGNLSGELALPPASLIEFRLEKPAAIPAATK
jgi:hypothetical protein